MVCADTVNFVYIFPITKVTGFIGINNVFVEPFYWLRDSLYNIGLSLYPKNEGEKEIWWWQIKFGEFREIIAPRIDDYILHGKDLPFTFIEKNRFYKWIDELYAHLELFANAKVSDPQYELEKYNKFLILAQANIIYYSRLYYHRKEELGHTGPLFLSRINRARAIRIYEAFEKYKTYAKNNEKAAYDYVENNPHKKVSEYIFTLYALDEIVISSYVTKDLDCNGKFINLYGNYRNNLDIFFQRYASFLTPEEIRSAYAMKDFGPAEVDSCKKCKSNPTLKNLIRDIEKNAGKSIYELPYSNLKE